MVSHNMTMHVRKIIDHQATAVVILFLLNADYIYDKLTLLGEDNLATINISQAKSYLS